MVVKRWEEKRIGAGREQHRERGLDAYKATVAGLWGASSGGDGRR